MKITKFLLLALSLSIFSCTQEDVSVTPETSSATNLKDRELTERDVERLKKEFDGIMQSSAFIEKKQKTVEFIELMGYNFSEDWTTRADVERFLEDNLSQTEFTSVGDGLAAFDNLDRLTKSFYVANNSFYEELSFGTNEQIKDILHPITIQPDVPVQTTNSCDDDCLAEYEADLEFALDVWIVNMDFGDYSGQSSYYTFADTHFYDMLNNAEVEVWSCFDDCDS